MKGQRKDFDFLAQTVNVMKYGSCFAFEITHKLMAGLCYVLKNIREKIIDNRRKLSIVTKIASLFCLITIDFPKQKKRAVGE